MLKKLCVTAVAAQHSTSGGHQNRSPPLSLEVGVGGGIAALHPRVWFGSLPLSLRPEDQHTPSPCGANWPKFRPINSKMGQYKVIGRLN